MDIEWPIKVMGWYDKSNVKRRYTLCCPDQYMCRRLRLQNSRNRAVVLVYKYMQMMETVKQSR